MEDGIRRTITGAVIGLGAGIAFGMLYHRVRGPQMVRFVGERDQIGEEIVLGAEGYVYNHLRESPGIGREYQYR